MNAVVRWFAPVLPEARVAILRTVLYAFVLLDIHTFVRDPIPLSRHPELYSPLLLARLLHLPPPSVPLTVTPLRRPADQLRGGRGQPAAAAGRLSWSPPPSPGGPRSG